MAERVEQHYCIKFCQKLGDSQVETIWKIQPAFGDDAMSSTQIKERYNRFEGSHTSVESEPSSSRPSSCRNDQVIAEVNAVVMRDRRAIIQEIAEQVGISTFSAHSIMTEDVAMKRVAAKFVPKLIMVEQKQLRVEVSQDMLDSTNSDPDFMNTIITGDESWVYGYDPETKSQTSQWKHSTSPRPKKAGQVCSNVKVMLTAFFDFCGVAHHQYAPHGQIITKEYYRHVFRHLRDVVRHKRLELWSTGNWRIHHDNAPAHSLHLIKTFFGEKPDSCSSTGSLLS
ncbi:protein GVQW3-like [Dermacentor variabilis]|uniref:protein GVQW3-like n=1 Tax=Dermacentor variabilis TaxID=34621 RepID=UPI003F5C5B6C